MASRRLSRAGAVSVARVASAARVITRVGLFQGALFPDDLGTNSRHGVTRQVDKPAGSQIQTE